MSRPSSAGWLTAAAVAVLGILAVLSWQKSLTGDEALTVALARSSFSDMTRTVAVESHVPGYYALMWLWVRLFGHTLPSLRILAFLPVAALLLVAGGLHRRHLPIILAASPFLLHLGVELRMYGLLAALSAGILLTMQAIDRQFTRRRFALLAALCIAAVWTHHFGWPAVAASAVLLLMRRRRLEALLLTAIVVASYIPWAPNILRQAARFGPAADGGAADLARTASIPEMVLGIPFSIAGTLLRFSAGTAAFSFEQFSVRAVTPWTAAGLVLAALFATAALRGLRKAFAPAVLLLCLVMVPVSLLRPSARHFSLAFPAFALIAASGLDRPGRLSGILRTAVPLLSLVMCVPFIMRSTLPQRCTFDRDLREAAIVAGTTARAEGADILVYLDNHSTLAVLYHLEDEGFGDVAVRHPHEEHWRSDGLVYMTPEDILAFLMQDTGVAISRLRTGDGPFVILANDPREARGPSWGGENRIVGRGSDTVADEDLYDVLSSTGSVIELDLPSSEGPFSAFLVTPSAGGGGGG